jgi:cysteine desulfurase
MSTERRSYLDHAATTPMHPEAVEAMLPFLGEQFGNPSGSHSESRRARLAIDDAREQIAELLGAEFGEVVFTSGGTESDNLAIAGGWEATVERGRKGDRSAPRVLVCSAFEHHAVLETCRALARRTGAELREVPPGKDGVIDLDALAEACDPDVAVASVMTVNNEIGALQPVADVAAIVRDRAPAAAFHTDAVQAVAWLDVADTCAPADLVTVSAHKFGGPKGVGVLVVRDGTGLRAQLHGGGQERERRSGTHDVPGIVGCAAALAATAAGRPETVERIGVLRDHLCDGLLSGVPGSAQTGDRASTVAGIAHLRFAGVEGETLVVLLDEAGVAASAGAACSSGAVAASHVLESMGMSRAEAASGVRFSLGTATSAADVAHALEVVPVAVDRLRG